MIEKWQKLSSEVFHENKWWQGVRDHFRLASGLEIDYHYISTPGGVVIIAQDNEGKILVHREYRCIFDKDGLSFPGGGIKPGQTIKEAAASELAEETGMTGDLVGVGSFAANYGLIDEIDNVFIAVNLKPVFAVKDETEKFEPFRLTPEEIDAAIANGEIWDAFNIAAWSIAKPHLKI